MIVWPWKMIWRVWHDCRVCDCKRLRTKPLTLQCKKCGRVWMLKTEAKREISTCAVNAEMARGINAES